jgi:hypothetical protein
VSCGQIPDARLTGSPGGIKVSLRCDKDVREEIADFCDPLTRGGNLRVSLGLEALMPTCQYSFTKGQAKSEGNSRSFWNDIAVKAQNIFATRIGIAWRYTACLIGALEK